MEKFNIRKILVPIDFSPASMNALDTAISMAKRHHASILLLHVVETIGLSTTAGDDSQTAGSVVEMLHHSEQQLGEVRHSVTERCMIPCEIISATGIVSATIIKISLAKQADIIVVGTHGTSGYRASLIGINAFNTVMGAACPVLTVPAHKKWESFKKILFPVRPVAAALEKYDFIKKIIRTNDATLKILGLSTDEEREVDWVRDMTTRLNDQLKEDQVAASTYFKVGANMAAEVLKIALVMETDLIVITASIDATADEVLMAPYIRYVMNHALFPVLSIKPCIAEPQQPDRMPLLSKNYSLPATYYN